MCPNGSSMPSAYYPQMILARICYERNQPEQAIAYLAEPCAELQVKRRNVAIVGSNSLVLTPLRLKRESILPPIYAIIAFVILSIAPLALLTGEWFVGRATPDVQAIIDW